MIDKKKMATKIDQAKALADKYELKMLSNEFEMLKKVNDDYKINVLFIGGYSAGKSALLNCLIGSEKLVENQAPETAIATELCFAEVDSIYAVDMDGKMARLSSTDQADPEKHNHLVYNIFSEQLRDLPEYIMVDTPGFDSGIERHNKALMQYIGNKGTAYIIVVDCEKGTLSNSALNYLNEVSHYSNDIAVIINKCDKKTKDDVEAIKNHVVDLIVSNCGKECPVITTSKYDDDVSVKLKSLIHEFDPQELYEKNIGSLVESKISDLKKALTIIEKNEFLDVSDFDIEIAKREKTKEKLQKEIKIKQENMKRKKRDEIKNRIVNDISVKLNNNARALADAYKTSVECLQEKVISLVRPIIVKSVKDYEIESCEELIKSIEVANLDFGEGIDAEEVGKILSDVLVKIESVSNALNSVRLSEENEGGVDTSKYKAIMSLLAITTDVVAPPLEILIVFLPDIIKLVNVFMVNHQEQQLVSEIQKKVIPQIANKVAEQLDTSLESVEQVMVQNIEDAVVDLLQVETDALEKAKQKKSEKETEFNNYISELRSDIALLA